VYPKWVESTTLDEGIVTDIGNITIHSKYNNGGIWKRINHVQKKMFNSHIFGKKKTDW
jgi:hypothetical protein